MKTKRLEATLFGLLLIFSVGFLSVGCSDQGDSVFGLTPGIVDDGSTDDGSDGSFDSSSESSADDGSDDSHGDDGSSGSSGSSGESGWRS